ncbi:response regulator [Arcticibacter svalbardensis MN12-7]|uniref:Response regulator n=2 Tax=Arcticibacter TaxID=1288026 RepID=R9GNX2_9SPHI|nr:response regulator [Arcticibacter svalbardensis MN12-7]
MIFGLYSIQLLINKMKKILVIEDDYDIGFTVEMALADEYVVMVLNEAFHIISSLHDFLPDLILIDNSIGPREAPEIINEIRSFDAYQNIPFVLFSAHPNIEKIADDILANAYLAKPFDLDDLYSCIEGVLELNN